MIDDEQTFKEIAKTAEPVAYETYTDLLYEYLKEKNTNKGCICGGNLRALVKEHEHLFDRVFKNEKNQFFTFFGIVIGSDDYYYGLVRHSKGTVVLSSCVLRLENAGYELVETE